jgi:dipeptidase
MMTGGHRTALEWTTTARRRRLPRRPFPLLLLPLLLLAATTTCHACTNILVTPGASHDGASIIAYNADSPTLFGVLYHYPAADNNIPNGTMRKIYDWDSGVYLGEIPETTSFTYNVVGNANEHGLVIGETTFGGVPILAWNQTKGIIDYGSLIYLTLQRCKTIACAIDTISTLLDTYGYASGGESFSLTDYSGDVWMMEVIGTGNEYNSSRLTKGRGAVWVAIQIPNGAIAAHANQARIRTFPRNDPDHCKYAPDVVDVAKFYGLYPMDGLEQDFSFADAYDPIHFMEARQGEARVWSIFRQIADRDGTFAAQYESYATGRNLSNRMPLYITPYQKIDHTTIMALMSSHYENTALDSSNDVGAGLFASPYRPRPLEWTYMGQSYHNERSVATAKTGWNFIAVVRPWMPAALSTILWFACDDSSTAPRVPVYASSTRIAPPYQGQGSQDGVVTPLLTFDLDKAFWVQNMVSNFAYYRWMDVYPVLQNKLRQVHEYHAAQLYGADQAAMFLYDNDGVDAAIEYVTQFGYDAGIALHEDWKRFYGELFVRFRDLYDIVPQPNEPVCNCVAKEPGMSEAVKKRIVDETGDRYKVIQQQHQHKPSPDDSSFSSSSSSMDGLVMDGRVVKKTLSGENPPLGILCLTAINPSLLF